MRRLSAVSAAIAALAIVPSSVQAATIVNGSFELGAISPGSFTTLGGGSTTITGWLVGGSSVDYMGGYWQAADGSRSVDLAGSGLGAISQTIDTVAGQAYRVAFAIARNPDGGLTPRTGLVEVVGGPSLALSFGNGASSRSNMGWQYRNFDFVASSASTTLRFASDSTASGFYGLALDDVSISAVPEPSTWMTIIAGLGVVAFAMRRRRRPQLSSALRPA